MAAGNTVRIYINGDASGVSKAARDAERALGRMSNSSKVSFGRMTEVAGGFGLAMGAGGVIGVLKDSVGAYQESEKSAARMGAQLQTIGQNTDAVTAKINDAIEAQSKFGAFDDEDLQDAFTRIVRSTGDVNEALDLNNLAMDIARGKGVDLSVAAEAVAKAYDGNVGALRRMGVAVDKGASAQDALAAAQAKYGGQAKAYGETSAAAADRASIAWGNAKEAIGERAADAFAQAADGASSLAGKVDGAVDALGGFQSVLIAGGTFAAISKFGPVLADAGVAMQGFGTQVAGIKKNAGFGAAISASAKTAGGALLGLAGGPMGVAALAAGGLALGMSAAASAERTVGDAARDAADALRDLAGAQLDAQGAALDTEQAEIGLNSARKDSRNALSRLHQAEAGMRRVRKQHLEDTPAGVAAMAKYRQAVDNQKQSQLNLEQAYLRVKRAKQNEAEAQGRVAAQAKAFNADLTTLTDTVNKNTETVTLSGWGIDETAARMRAARIKAAEWADSLVDMANNSDDMTAANKDTARAVAETVRQIGRLPSQKEIDLISNAIATGASIDDVRRLLGLLPPKTPANVSSNAGSVKDEVDHLEQSLYNLNGNVTTVYIDTVRRNKGPAGGGAATGASIAGRFDGADNVPINVSRGEVVLNPTQIAMVGAGRVFGALRATGAPTIVPGGSFAGGGTNTMSGGPRKTETWRDYLDRSSATYQSSFNTLDARLAAAERTPSPDDDTRVRGSIRTLIRKRIVFLRGAVAMAPRKLRGEMYGEIASLTRSLSQYEASTSGGGGGDTSDLEARLAQAEARAAAAGRNLALSESALSTFGGVGAGAGRATIVQFHSIFPPTPDQYRSGAAFMSDAFGRQSYRRTPRIRIGA